MDPSPKAPEPLLHGRPPGATGSFAVRSHLAGGYFSGRVDSYRGLDGPFGIWALSIDILKSEKVT